MNDIRLHTRIYKQWVKGKLWVLKVGQKMDEGVKYLIVTYGQFTLSFYRHLKFPLLHFTNFESGVYKTRKTHSINLLRWIFGEIPLNAFRHQKRVHSLKNTGGTTFAVEGVKFFFKYLVKVFNCVCNCMLYIYQWDLYVDIMTFTYI